MDYMEALLLGQELAKFVIIAFAGVIIILGLVIMFLTKQITDLHIEMLRKEKKHERDLRKAREKREEQEKDDYQEIEI